MIVKIRIVCFGLDTICSHQARSHATNVGGGGYGFGFCFVNFLTHALLGNNQNGTVLDIVAVFFLWLGVGSINFFISSHRKKIKQEEAKLIYQSLENQVSVLKEDNEVILGGDFNPKLEIKTKEAMQRQSRNGKLLQQLIEKKMAWIQSWPTQT